MYSYVLRPKQGPDNLGSDLRTATYHLNIKNLQGIYSRALLSSATPTSPALRTSYSLAKFDFANANFIDRDSSKISILDTEVEDLFKSSAAYPLIFGRILARNKLYPPHLYYIDENGTLKSGNRSQPPSLAIGYTSNARNTSIVSIPIPISVEELHDFLAGFLLLDSIMNVYGVEEKFPFYIYGFTNGNLDFSEPLSLGNGFPFIHLDLDMQNYIFSFVPINALRVKKNLYPSARSYLLTDQSLSNNALKNRLHDLLFKVDLSNADIAQIKNAFKYLPRDTIMRAVLSPGSMVQNAEIIDLIVKTLIHEPIEAVQEYLELGINSGDLIRAALMRPEFTNIDANGLMQTLLMSSSMSEESYTKAFTAIYQKLKDVPSTTEMRDILVKSPSEVILMLLGDKRIKPDSIFLQTYYRSADLYKEYKKLGLRPNPSDLVDVIESAERGSIDPLVILMMLEDNDIDANTLNNILSALVNNMDRKNITEAISIVLGDPRLNLSINKYKAFTDYLSRIIEFDDPIVVQFMSHPSFDANWSNGYLIAKAIVMAPELFQLFVQAGAKFDINLVIMLLLTDQYSNIQSLEETLGASYKITSPSPIITAYVTNRGHSNRKAVIDHTENLNDPRILDMILAIAYTLENSPDDMNKLDLLLEHPGFDLLTFAPRLLYTVIGDKGTDALNHYLKLIFDRYPNYSIPLEVLEYAIQRNLRSVSVMLAKRMEKEIISNEDRISKLLMFFVGTSDILDLINGDLVNLD